MIKFNKIINSIKLILFLNNNHIKNNKKFRFLFISLLVGITGGLAVLIVVISIMNGFQYNHISRRMEIGSYHINITKIDNKNFSYEELKNFKEILYGNISDIDVVVPYTDLEVIFKLNRRILNDVQILKLRAVDPDEIIKDKKFNNFFKIEYGKFDLSLFSILVGEAMGERITATLDSELLISPDISISSFNLDGIPFKIKGFFKTDSYDYDRYWGFISLYSLYALKNNIDVDNIGIKIKNYENVKSVLNKIKKLLNNQYLKFETSDEINKGYFAALKLEKALILLLFILIFIIVSINTYGSMKLLIVEKKKDIAILKSLGLIPLYIKLFFLIETQIITFISIFSGTIIGFFISYNITNIFKFIEKLLNSILQLIAYLLEYAIPGIYFNPVVIYDNSVYYQTTFLVKVNLFENILIYFFIILLAFISTYIPLLKIDNLKPNEILRT